MNPIESSLYKKYNVAGPRYTSYPTVPYWDTTPSVETYIEGIYRALIDAEKEGIGAGLYIHIPFCQSLCTYCGCNTRITRNTKVGEPYVQTVLKEFDLYLSKLGKTRLPLTELHLGGGTPTFLAVSELQELLKGILRRVNPTSDHEFSVEADPRVTSKEHLQALFDLGFRRLSLGIQDFDPKVQEVVHRVQSIEQVKYVTDTARAIGFNSINFDLIYGLPFQTQNSVLATVEAVKSLKPDRIAFYGYAHVPWIKPGQRRFTEDDLPTGDAKRELYELGRAQLERVGYGEIGMDHFALKTDSLAQAAQKGTLHRGFMGYMSRQVAPLIGLGVSAIGDSWWAFSQNEKLLESYVSRVKGGEIPILRGHVLNEEDLIVRRQILNLMTRFRTEWDPSLNQLEVFKSLPERVSELARDGLVELGANTCLITLRGRPFLRNICMAFDARLIRKAPTTELFSQTI